MAINDSFTAEGNNSYLSALDLCSKVENSLQMTFDAQSNMEENEFCLWKEQFLRETGIKFDHHDLENYYPKFSMSTLLQLTVRINSISSIGEFELEATLRCSSYDLKVFLYDYHFDGVNSKWEKEIQVGKLLSIKGNAFITYGPVCIWTMSYEPKCLLSDLYKQLTVDFDGNGFFIDRVY